MNEFVAYDSPQPCSYLPGQTAVLPLRYQRSQVTEEEFDACLASGDRRTGRLLYRTACPLCSACEPIRLDLDSFRLNATQRREWRKGNELLEVTIGEPIVDDERVSLYNAHLLGRHLKESEEDAIGEEEYCEFLVSSCCRTLEFAYRARGELVAVAIVDAGRTSLSAVYCYYDPRFRTVSLGTYSVLRQVEYCQQTGRRYLYLGFYIAESPHMAYKAKFHPHQRLIAGEWRDVA